MPRATRKTCETPRAAAPAAQVTRSQDSDAQEAAAAAVANNSNRRESDACRLFSPTDPGGTTNQNKRKRKRNHADTLVGSMCWHAQDQAQRKQEQQLQQEAKEDEDEVEEEKEDDQHSLQQSDTNENDNAANETRNDDENPGDEDDYVQEPDGDWLDYVDENYGEHLSPEELKEKKRKLSPETREYWEHFKDLIERYELRWDIKFTDFYNPGEDETDTVMYKNKTQNAILYDDWRDCCGLVKSDDIPVLNEEIGIYIAIICGPDPNITYNVAKIANELKAALPNHGKSEEEMNSLANHLKDALLDCTELTKDRNSRFTMKVGCILKQMLYKRLRNLIDFNSRPGQIQFKFFATKDLCPERVLILEDLIKFSLWLEKRYSGNGEVYYGNKFVANHLLEQAKMFAKNGCFTYKVKEEETIKAGTYTNHPKYQEYRSETNLNIKRAMKKRKQSEGQETSMSMEMEEDPQHNEDEDTNNFVL